MKKRCKMIIALLSAAMVLTACAQNTSDTDSNKANDTKTQDTSKDVEQDDTETEKTKEYQAKLDMIEPSAYRDASGLSLEEGAYISIIGKGTNDDFWVQVKKGAEQAGKDINEQLGYKGKKAVKVVYSGPSDKGNVDEQVNILDEELSRYPAALAISIADAKACEVQFDQAGWNGTPIVTFDSSSDYPGISAFVSTDNSASATEAANRLAEAMGESGEVMLFMQDSKSQVAQTRENAFEASLRTAPARRKIEITAYVHAERLLLVEVENAFDGAVHEKAGCSALPSEGKTGSASSLSAILQKRPAGQARLPIRTAFSQPKLCSADKEPFALAGIFMPGFLQKIHAGRVAAAYRMC